MIKIEFVDERGGGQEIFAQEGDTLMRVACDNMVPGIIGECGGFLSCGTCHVKVDPDWIDRVPPAGTDELAMIEGLTDTTSASRLSCQITIEPSLSGLRVLVPATNEEH